MPEQMTDKWAADKTVTTDRGPVVVKVRCNAFGSWSATRSIENVPAEWAAGIGEVGELISRVVEGDPTAWAELADVEFPHDGPRE